METITVKKATNYVLLIFLSVFCFTQINAQKYLGHLDEQLKKMNPPLEIEAPYSFFATGHLYGDPTSVTNPASTLLNQLASLKVQGDFWITLGDSYKQTDEEHLSAYRKNFLEKMIPPVINVVGNHEYDDPDLYDTSFGPTYFSFEYQGDLFVVLNTELANGDIEGEQLEWLKKTEQRIIDNQYRNTFICMHKLIWTVQDRYEMIYRRCNARGGHTTSSKYLNEVHPIFEKMAKETQLYILSGDVGKSWSYPLFYDHNQDQNIHYIATGIGNLPTDMLLEINVSKEGVDFKPIALGTSVTRPIEHYGMKEWSRYFKEGKTKPEGYNWLLIVSSIVLAFVLSFFFGKNEQ